MRIPVLLAATATRWAGPAQLPRELVKAGFDVAVLAPRGALVSESRHVTTVNHLPDKATPMQWLFTLAACVESWSPRLIVPCDDTALQLMMSIVETPPHGMDGLHRGRLHALVRESLGEPRHYRSSIDKTLLPPAAEALRVRVPPYAVIADAAAALAFAQTHDYPVVLKRAFGTAGDAVEVVQDDAGIEPAFRRLLSSKGTSLWNSVDLLVQAWIPGKGLLHAVAAWGGVALAGMTREVLMRSPATGPSTVVCCRHAPEARRFSHLIAEFPQEWLRDPGSSYLKNARADVPWDDPHLFRAMLAMRPRE